jgi:glucose uptake protein
LTVVESYPVAVALSVVTVLRWGSWANTQKLAGRDWPFQLSCRDWSLGLMFAAFVLGLGLIVDARVA